ncbi:MAG: ABC transporter ATP-binding protein/permease [Marinobacterium sp.]|nr:ABC transporter ATP-binding protein/permease [Marinobacterium sp.]
MNVPEKTEGGPEAPLRFWQCLEKGQRRLLGVALLAAGLAAVLELAPLLLIVQLCTQLLTQPGWPQWPELLMLLVGLIVLKTACYSLAYGCSHKAAYSLLLSLRQRLLNVLEQLPLHRLEQLGSADIKQRMVQDVEVLEISIAHHLVEGAVALLLPLLLIGWLAQLAGPLALAAALPLCVAGLVVSLAGRASQQDARQHSAALSRINSAVLAFMRALPVMKLYRQDAERFYLLRQQQHDYSALLWRLIRRSAPLWAVYTVLVSSCIATVLATGVWLWQQQVLTLAELVSAVLLASALLRPVLKVTRLGSELARVQGSWQRIVQLLNEPRSATSVVTPASERRAMFALEVKNLSVQQQGRTLLRQVDLQLQPGTTTLLIGPSGAGKSLLLQLISGLYPLQQGAVMLAGQSLTELSGHQQAAARTLVTQHSCLFNGSVRSNLCLGRNPDDAEIWQALALVSLADKIRALPRQLDTPLNPGGSNFSGGEQQRLALARALLSPAPLLLLDEATAFADRQTTARFLRQLRQRYPDRTLLIISHSPLPQLAIDQMVVMEQGRIIASGNHDRLLFKSAFYRAFQEVADVERV